MPSVRAYCWHSACWSASSAPEGSADQEDDVPTYAYACTACGHRFEVQQSFSDASLTECPECQGKLRKLFNTVGIVFKGSGFYRTDSRTPANAASNGSSNESSNGSSNESSNGSSSESTSKPAETSSSSSSSSDSSKPSSPKPNSSGSKPSAPSAPAA